VVELSAFASGVLEDASEVELPPGVSCDCDRHGAGLQSLLQCGVSLVDVDESLGGHLGVSLVLSAGTVDALVGVSRLEFGSCSLEVSESVVHESSVATLVGLAVTVDQLLLRELEQVFRCDSPSGLKGSDGGECPA